MITYVDFLIWVRGPAFQISLSIFLIGVVLRLSEILLLGGKPDYAKPRGNRMQAGLRTIVTRSKIDEVKLQSSTFTIILGYIFHTGFLIILLFYAPHVIFFHEVIGLRWPSLPTPIIVGASVITLLALLSVLIHRLVSPVLRFISTPQDYLVWAITFLPVLTGYMAFYHIGTYPLMLAFHILSVELLMIVFPFTKLMHAFTLVIARWYNGANAGRKGVEV